MTIWTILEPTLLITCFVTVMMILVEYLNVLTLGRWMSALGSSRWAQYAAATILGATPGCLGAFTIVTLYVHRSVSLGAVVACMIATSGDEAFVMLAMFPGTALLLTAGLAGIGLAAGIATDMAAGSRPVEPGCESLTLHGRETDCRCFDAAKILPQLRRPSAARAALGVGILAFVVAVVAGAVGPPNWNWVRLTLLCTGLFALFVIATVPEHFIAEHLWQHVVLRHVPRIFLWTGAAMGALALVGHFAHAKSFIQGNPWLALIVASGAGLIPESGPHLLFVTLYDAGTVPLSVLVASSIVQDGHGMLPLLAHSWRAFIKVKIINLVAGLIVAGLLLLVGT